MPDATRAPGLPRRYSTSTSMLRSGDALGVFDPINTQSCTKELEAE
jgi:hypothetical protein